MSETERTSDRKRKSILQHAEELFSRHGFERVSIVEIARNAHVSPATVYNHFGTKQQLAREVIQSVIHTALEKYRAIIESERPFPAKVETIVLDKAQIASRYQGELLRTAYETDPDLRVLVQNLWQTEFDRLTLDLLDQGRRCGYVNFEVSREVLLLYLEIVRTGVFSSSSRLSDASLNPGAIQELNHLVLYGLMGRPPNVDTSH